MKVPCLGNNFTWNQLIKIKIIRTGKESINTGRKIKTTQIEESFNVKKLLIIKLQNHSKTI